MHDYSYETGNGIDQLFLARQVTILLSRSFLDESITILLETHNYVTLSGIHEVYGHNAAI